MTDFEKINGLLDKIKTCPDADLSLYIEPLIPLFLVFPKTEMNELTSAFYEWARENAGEQSLKFFYSEFFMSMKYIRSENFEQALPLLSKARKSFEEKEHIDGIEMCSLAIGATYRSLANFDLALKILIKPFEFFKRSGRYPIWFEGSCNTLGNVNFELRNYEEAFSIFNSGYEASLISGNYYFRIYALEGMGKVKMRQDKPGEARTYFHKALEEAEKSTSPMHLSNSLTELAMFSFNTGNLAEAEHLNKLALAIREQHNFTGAVVTSLINLGEIYINQAKWEEAIEALRKALAMAEQMNVKPKMYQVHLLLSKAYKSIGDPEQSLHHYEIYHELREKVQEEDNARKLTDARLIFEAEQTQKENIIIKKQKQEIENKNYQLQETIDELTITKVSRKARGITLIVGIALIIAEDPIMAYVLRRIGEGHFWLSITAKIIIIFSLRPIDTAIEGYLLHRLVLKKRKHLAEKSRNNTTDNQSAIAAENIL